MRPPRTLALLPILAVVSQAFSQGLQSDSPGMHVTTDVFSSASCMSCHGQSAMGGLGPPIARTKLTLEEVRTTVRTGKGMMPATPPSELSDSDVDSIYRELQAKPWDPTQIPISYKVGQLLTTSNVALIFFVVFSFATIFAIKVLFYWLGCAGVKQLWPYMKRMGLFATAGIVLKSLLIDGLCVASLWRRNRFRWMMHGLILYGFFGLMLADILMQVFNPTRGELPLLNPLKILPILSGLAVFTGVAYVMFRYKKDAYVDNGLTLGRDFLFVNLLFHTILSGFLTVAINRSGAHGYAMPIYIYHLSCITLLIMTAPFTRFAHAWVVPSLVAVTRVTEEITARGIDLGFLREPSPGRHHKSERIAEDVLKSLGPNYQGEFRLRYYP